MLKYGRLFFGFFLKRNILGYFRVLFCNFIIFLLIDINNNIVLFLKKFFFVEIFFIFFDKLINFFLRIFCWFRRFLCFFLKLFLICCIKDVFDEVISFCLIIDFLIFNWMFLRLFRLFFKVICLVLSFLMLRVKSCVKFWRFVFNFLWFCI